MESTKVAKDRERVGVEALRVMMTTQASPAPS